MTLLAPLALAGLIFVPLIIAFYLLRLRRDDHSVSSTYLWQKLVRDVEANAPWQKLRRSLLLLLQLILVILLVFLVARPTSERPAGLAHDLVLVIDASASMAATDIYPDRLTAAKKAALDALSELPADGKVSVVAAAETARVVANEATDRGRVARAIESITQSTAPGQMGDALKLAGELAERATGAEVLVVTDDAASAAPDIHIAAPVRVVTVGTSRDNQAIAALAVRSDASGLKRTVFVSVANYSDSIVTRRLRILADGFAVTARDLQLAAVSRTDVVIDELPAGTRVVQAQISVIDDGSTAAAPGPVDRLSLDDSAWAIVPPDKLQKILLVGPGNAYLQTALALLPNVELYGATGEEYATTTGKDQVDLFVFDGFLPPELPNAAILAIAPPATSPLGTVVGTLTNPAIGQGSPDEPLLRNVDLSRLHVAKSQNITLPDWARVIVPGGVSSPLIYSGVRDGLPTAVIAFDLRQSDLPLQVAWPIIASNLTGELLGLSTTGSDPIAPASPVELPIRPGVASLRITLPDGSVTELTPSASGASEVTFVQTLQLGVYHVDAVLAPVVEPSGGASPTPVPTATPVPSPGASAGPTGSEDDADAFAVDLFAPDESNISPGDGTRLVALGGAAVPGEATTGVAHDEWWPLLVLGALILLLIEWAVYERDGARRIWHGIRGSARRPSLRRGGPAS
ncbi:MAG: VWA domain-containing protein [Candidatus Limnocylindrales bacterium]